MITFRFKNCEVMRSQGAKAQREGHHGLLHHKGLPSTRLQNERDLLQGCLHNEAPLEFKGEHLSLAA